MKFGKAHTSAILMALALAAPSAEAQTTFTQRSVFNIPEANQGVAVDKFFFYAINNQTIAKYTKSGKFVAKWEGAASGPIIHLDSGVVVNGKLYAAHSNYRKFPLTSSIEVWDTQTMKHIGSHSIGIGLGSLTWLDQHDGSWYGAFANYDKTGQLPSGANTSLPYASVPDLGKISSTVVRFNSDWQVVEGWVFPPELLNSFGDMSNSGGSWGPDGRLYITGHDNTEVYKIRFPEAGSVLEVEETIPATVRGQGIAWDITQPGIFYGIIRATDAETTTGVTNKVVVYQTNVPKRDPKDWLNDAYRYRP
ncbi:MAG TPA: hypothetical protein VGC79_08240 [Polyangiaceae bacterium]